MSLSKQLISHRVTISRYSSPRSFRRTFASGGPLLPGSKEQPEDQPMRDKQGWHECGWNEERGAEHPGVNRHAELPLVKGKEQVGRAPHIEQPHQPRGQGCSPGKCDAGRDREDGCKQIAVCGRSTEGRWERGRDNP